MGVRLTGISTPVGGVSWEYTKGAERSAPLSIFPRQKIKVFISSICGVEKYDKVRDELKTAIERTQLAYVYTFESKEASTLPAGNHYTWALEDSDICIFLIDNTDGIKPGVQAEIDTVKKHNIKALYYFCDETQKEKTALEQSLMGAHFAKSKTVHHFSELSQDGAQALIDDIVAVYHYYCTGKIVLNSGENDEIQAVDVVGTEKYQLPTIPKSTLKNVDKCRDYFLKFVLGYSRGRYPDETENTSEFDDWGIQFLPILFEGKSINILELMPYIQGDVATTIAVTRLIAEYLESSDEVMLPSRVEAIILQNVLQWLHSEYTDIRWNATRILLTMSRNPENYGIVNHQLVNLIDSDSVYIKNLIIRHLYTMNGIAYGTKDYIVSKCKQDANFVVRMVCAEVEKGANKE